MTYLGGQVGIAEGGPLLERDVDKLSLGGCRRLDELGHVVAGKLDLLLLPDSL